MPRRCARPLTARRACAVLATIVVAVFAAATAWAGSARAATVLVLGSGGHVSVREDPFLTGPAAALTPPPAARGRQPAFSPRRGTRTVPQALAQLHRTQAITAAAYDGYSAIYRRALRAEQRLSGTPAAELAAVIANVREIAAARMLTSARLPAVFQTLQRNIQWWTSGPIPAPGQLIEFSGSQLVWEYYAGQGLELQVLGTFSRADAFYTAGPADYPKLSELLSEMLPLATHRGGGLTWEYYFHFDGGSPPWTSAMSQGTAIEALTRAYEAFGNSNYLTLAHRALTVFTIPPPAGVAVPAADGTWYIQYTFAPRANILNAFLQALIGLYDYAKVSGDPLAARLFAAGNAEALAVVPQYDTGAWSLYQPGVEDPLSYHELVTGFLQQLCSRTGAQVYCVTAQHFTTYLKTPPVLQLITATARAKAPLKVRFHLSKYSHVGIVLVRGGTTVFQTSAEFGYGTDAFSVPALRAGTYTVRLAATDLAGNFSRIVGTLTVSGR